MGRTRPDQGNGDVGRAAAIVTGAMRQGDNRAGPATRADDADPPAAGPVLVVTKLRAPTVRAELVPRRRLVDLLVRPGPHKLTLIDAPAGWGKTTLLAEWQDDPEEPRQFAWVLLDRADNDPVRFWSYVVTALWTVAPGLGGRALAALGGRGPSTTRVVLPELINELATGAPELVLVLDDYHTIGNDEIHEGLELLLERLPAQLHLAMASRSDPPLPLARMRIRGELLEVRSDALAFSDEEATALLNRHLGSASPGRT